jgi:hypothetical protein
LFISWVWEGGLKGVLVPEMLELELQRAAAPFLDCTDVGGVEIAEGSEREEAFTDG